MASVPVSEEGRSPPDTPAEQQQQQWQGKAKRAQVKNACNNCQRACKRCDSGRPCQRCVKYNMADTCVDSKRKPRKKGIKRGPYKKRKRNTSHDDDSQSNATSSLTETTTNTNTTNTTNTTSTAPPPPPPPGARRSGSGVGIGRRAAAETAHGRPRRPHRPRPPQILGPGAIAILHADPAADDGGDDGAGAGAGRSSGSRSSGSGSGSDTPLVQHRRAAFPQHGGGAFHQQHHQQPETPTMGLTAAFNTLATVHRQHYHHHHPAQLPLASSAITTSSSRPPLQYSQPPAYHHALPPLPFMRGAGPVRLPPIESFDHAQPQPQPQSRPPSSLAMLTDVALRRSPPSLHAMPQQNPQDPQNQNPQNPQNQNPQNMSRRHQHGRQRTASDAVEQQSLLDVPEDPHNSSRHTTSAESDMSSVPSSFDSRQSLHHRFSNDNLTRAHIRRLSRRLHDTHLEQEYADKEDESAWLPDADYDDDDDDDDDAAADFADSALSC